MKFSRDVENLIANLRGLPEDRNRSTVNQAYKLDTLTEVLLEKYHIGQPRTEEVIMKKWSHIMGEANAPRCAPIKIDRRKQLLISVSHPTLRQELSFEKSMILNRIRRLPGCSEIIDIRFVAG